ncbi:hypothetical protein As57867_013623, partial [Aphanomyces stellatus]
MRASITPPSSKPLATADASTAKDGHGATYTAGVPTAPECATMFEYLQRSVQRNPTGDFLGHRPKGADGVVGPDYEWQSYETVFGRIQSLAAGLLHHDMIAQTTDANERILGIYMKNRPEWVLAHYAVMYAGGFSVALYDTLGADATPYVLNQTQVATIVCTSAELPKVVQAKASSPALQHVILCDVETKPEAVDGLTLWTMKEIEAVGAEHPAFPTPPVPTDIYTLIYTSGTTGEPKGVPLRHSNLVHAIAAINDR